MEKEVYFSGVSSSTKASALNKSDINTSESLEAQLDRLNMTLLDLLQPESRDLDSFSFQNTSEIENSVESSVLYPEPALNIEGLQMIQEDFRSHEVRFNEKSLKKLETDCEMSDLYNLLNNLSTSIQLVEQGLTKWVSLKLGAVNLTANVKNGFFLPNKEKILDCFSLKTENVQGYISQLENEIEELKYKLFHWNPSGSLDEIMLQAFQDSFDVSINKEKTEPCKNCKNLATQTSLEIETRLSNSLNQSRKRLLSDLDWQVAQTKLMKSSYESKVNDLSIKEKKLAIQVKEINSEVMKKCKVLDKEKAKFLKEQEKNKESQNSLKKKVAVLLNDLKSLKLSIEKTEILPDIADQSFELQVSDSTPRNFPVEGQEIDKEISQLEEQLKRSPSDSNLHFKLTKLKTRQSTLKSAKILDTCSSRRISAFLKSPIISTNPTPKASGLGFAFPASKASRMSNWVREDKSCDVSVCSPLTTSRTVYNEGYAKEENLSKTLELKEARLRKKEEELIKQELKLQNNWMKLPNANELIPIVRHEVEKYVTKSEELRKRELEIDELVQSCLDDKKRSKAIREEIEKVQEEIREKVKKAEKIEEIASNLEELFN